MLRWLKTVVASDEEKASVEVPGGDREGERERTAVDVSKQLVGIGTGENKSLRDGPGGCPSIGQVVPGMKAARARSAVPAWNVGRPVPILPPRALLASWRREGARRTAESGGVEYRCGTGWRTGP